MVVSPGTTDVSIDIRAMTSAGAALTGKVAADFTLWYRRDGAKVPISLSDLSALTDDHSDGGVKEISDGWYRLDLPDAACAAGANRVAIGGSVSGGVVLSAPIPIDSTWIASSRTLTQQAAEVVAAISGSAIVIYSGDKVTINITGLGSLAGRDDVKFAIKRNRANPDTAAEIFVSEEDGLVYLAGASAETATDASLTVTDESAGDIQIVIKADASLAMQVRKEMYWGVKLYPTGDGPRTLSEGSASVTEAIVQETDA